ncbi:glycerophosphoryl diester phosphodiesterase membrane domain-containing protein [Nonomuraea sp. NPDC049714]|uniref:glycerophosphoryl diester phosphodiesterase membrane domain-containing protein n=1 Tax=Nonomuraea sp. NPDC049714 TaxID=3364357 RepID=UPI0037886A51
MSDGHGPSPEPPSGWASEQPPPYGAPQASPWTAPAGGQQPPSGQQPYAPGPQPPQPPQSYGQMPYGAPGYGYTPHPQPLRPGIIPLRPLRLGDIFDGTIKLVRSNPKAVLGMSAIAALLAAIPLAVGQAFLFGDVGSALSDPTLAENGDPAVFGSVLAQYGGTLVSYAISFVVVTLLTGVLTRILGRAVFGGKMTAGEAWQASKGRMPALFGVVGLMALVMLAPVAVIAAVFAVLISSGLAGSPDAVGGLVVLFLVLMIFYIAYVLFFRARFAFAPAAVVLEGRGPIDALRRSWTLVTGDFWRVLGILLLTALVVGMVATVLQVPFVFGGTIVGVIGGGSAWTVVLGAILVAVGGTLGAMITYPFEAGVAGLLYADRRMRAEAFDLVLQTAAIEQQRQGWVHASADELWRPSDSTGP